MKSEHPEYDIASEASPLYLIETVNCQIKEGWRPVGSMAFVSYANGTTLCLQPMMRWPKLQQERKSEQ